MDTKPQVNKYDPEECDACIAIDSICDWHEGWSAGAVATLEVFQWTLENIEGVAQLATYAMNRRAEADGETHLV